MPLPVVFQLADLVPVRYRAFILLATFADMRWGELAGLRRENIDLEKCEVKITEELVQPNKGALFFDTPKSQAGKRTVAFPEEIVGEIRWHLDKFGQPGAMGLVFVGPRGGLLRRGELPAGGLDQGTRGSGAAEPAHPRSATHRRHFVGGHWRDTQGTHGEARAR